MNPAIAILDEEIKSLQGQFDRSKSASAEYRELAAAQEAACEVLACKISTLQEIRVKVAGSGDSGMVERDENNPIGKPRSPKKLKASAAIRRVLSQHPDGLPRLQIIDTVAAQMDSTAKNPRHIVRTTIFSMKRSGKLAYNDTTERYSLPNHAGMKG